MYLFYNKNYYYSMQNMYFLIFFSLLYATLQAAKYIFLCFKYIEQICILSKELQNFDFLITNRYLF